MQEVVVLTPWPLIRPYSGGADVIRTFRPLVRHNGIQLMTAVTPSGGTVLARPTLAGGLLFWCRLLQLRCPFRSVVSFSVLIVPAFVGFHFPRYCPFPLSSLLSIPIVLTINNS